MSEENPEKQMLFQSMMGVYGLYVEENIDWEELVEKLLGLAEQYREQKPIDHIGVAVGDKVGHWADGVKK